MSKPCTFLSRDHVAAAVLSAAPAERFIGAVVDHWTETVLFLRGSFTYIEVPFRVFREAMPGKGGTFYDVRLERDGQQVTLGDQTIAVAAILAQVAMPCKGLDKSVLPC